MTTGHSSHLAVAVVGLGEDLVVAVGLGAAVAAVLVEEVPAVAVDLEDIALEEGLAVVEEDSHPGHLVEGDTYLAHHTLPELEAVAAALTDSGLEDTLDHCEVALADHLEEVLVDQVDLGIGQDILFVGILADLQSIRGIEAHLLADQVFAGHIAQTWNSQIPVGLFLSQRIHQWRPWLDQ